MLQVHLGASSAGARCPVSNGLAASRWGIAKESQAARHHHGPWFRGVLVKKENTKSHKYKSKNGSK